MAFEGLSGLTQVDDPGAQGRQFEFSALFTRRPEVETISIGGSTPHPDLERAAAIDAYIRERDGFQPPDETAQITCRVCTFGVFNRETANKAMGRFLAIFKMNNETMNPPQLFKCLTQFWNEDVKRENPHVPEITFSATKYHFTECMKRFLPVSRLERQMDGLERLKNALEWDGIYSFCPPSVPGAAPGGSNIEEREQLDSINEKLTAITDYISENSGGDGAAAGGSSSRAGSTELGRRQRIFSKKTEKRVLNALGNMRANIADMKARRTRKPSNVAVSIKEAELYDKLCKTTIQTSKHILEYQKHNHTMDWNDYGLPAYTSVNSANNTTTVMEIYSGKKKTVTNSAATEQRVQQPGMGEIGASSVHY